LFFVANGVTALSVALPQVEQGFDLDVTTSGYLAARLDKPVLEDLRGLSPRKHAFEARFLRRQDGTCALRR
jgi:hypothetical protein